MGTSAVVMPPIFRFQPDYGQQREFTAAMLPTLQNSTGRENVIVIPAITCAEDFSYVSQKILGLYLFACIGHACDSVTDLCIVVYH